ncbi:hypothetical protein MA16_Dca004791 [Dendrobium catenatum]|uniref:Uncharacterized protein n=1 Tax=Dendrobium catenatum TaxID=906689 RepID=A0A2I0VP38_9ASPA|nr:hypothetical protein MA16_Dca004791 [Dendrobium catenatum]
MQPLPSSILVPFISLLFVVGSLVAEKQAERLIGFTNGEHQWKQDIRGGRVGEDADEEDDAVVNDARWRRGGADCGQRAGSVIPWFDCSHSPRC